MFLHTFIHLCCLFSGWFANEANVANNKQQLDNFMTQSQDEQERYECSETGSDVKLGRLVSEDSGTHHKCRHKTPLSTYQNFALVGWNYHVEFST